MKILIFLTFLFSLQAYSENSLQYKIECKQVNYTMEISKFNNCLQFTKLKSTFSKKELKRINRCFNKMAEQMKEAIKDCDE